MNIVNAGSNYQIYGEDLKTFKSLPTASYDVNFNKFQGFFLTLRAPLEVNEEKIYGSSERKVDKVLDAYQSFNRNMGVILSGQKGIGKSLFARILAIKSIERNIPLINVSCYIPGIADFISSIQQEVIVLFDEFEKTFGANDDNDPQEEMLSLFDGIDAGKKLFVITCNELQRLNAYMLNRPGRFHYHFTLSTPNAEEVREYMSDKLLPIYRDAIDEIVNFSVCTEMTYDCLRAIAFELNRGYTLKETLNDLNITKATMPRYVVNLTFSDGSIAETRGAESIDLFSTRRVYLWLSYADFSCMRIGFSPRDIKVDYTTGITSLDPNLAKLSYDDDDLSHLSEAEIAKIKSLTMQSIILTRDSGADKYRYMV